MYPITTLGISTEVSQEFTSICIKFTFWWSIILFFLILVIYIKTIDRFNLIIHFWISNRDYNYYSIWIVVILQIWNLYVYDFNLSFSIKIKRIISVISTLLSYNYLYIQKRMCSLTRNHYYNHANRILF